MATVDPPAMLAPLVKAAAAGAAEGGGGRQVVAAAVAAAIRSGAELFAPRPPSEVLAEVEMREKLGRPHLTEMVWAGREGAVARPSGASRAFRGWAQHADFGAGPQAAPASAAEARRRAWGRRRGAGDAAPAPTVYNLVKEDLEEMVSQAPGAQPMVETQVKKDFKGAPGGNTTAEVNEMGSAFCELALANTRFGKGETKNLEKASNVTTQVEELARTATTWSDSSSSCLSPEVPKGCVTTDSEDDEEARKYLEGQKKELEFPEKAHFGKTGKGYALTDVEVAKAEHKELATVDVGPVRCPHPRSSATTSSCTSDSSSSWTSAEKPKEEVWTDSEDLEDGTEAMKVVGNFGDVPLADEGFEVKFKVEKEKMQQNFEAVYVTKRGVVNQAAERVEMAKHALALAEASFESACQELVDWVSALDAHEQQVILKELDLSAVKAAPC
ncbi:unnamed protein product [Prorocentrum cordatum]|uniref:Uncharacterized protein n=1 Tax=Prorocentrum cordatum TaxID=2364126 RepID=A0ABN9QJF6_9DINO|nr:unnamed protein product [Polarella glacialis]